MRFSGFCFHIYWTCINWKLFLPLFSCKQSFILLFLFFGNTADLTQDIFASWGWHLPLPLLQEFVSIFSGPVWTKSRFTPLFLELDTRLEIFSFYDMEFIMQKCLLLGSRIDFGISCSSLGNNLRFAGILFHIFLTCVNGNYFYSSLFVNISLPLGFLYWWYGGFDAKPFDFWGQELTLWVSVVIRVIIWYLLAIFLLFLDLFEWKLCFPLIFL